MKSTFAVTGMTCAACASSVESMLAHTDGVLSASVNFASASVLVEHHENADRKKLREAVQSIGYDLVIDQENAEQAREDAQQKFYRKIKRRTWGSALCTLPIFILGMFFMHWEPGKWISMILSIPVLFYFGGNFFTGAFKNARHGKVNMDTLVALSTGIAFLFSLFNTLFPEYWLLRGYEPHVYYEAATVIITFITFGKLLEEKAKANTSSAIKKLIGLQPDSVVLVEGESEREIPVKEVQVGDILRVKPGMKIPLDGTVVSGTSFVDESMISGEPVAVSKSADDSVFAGTVNQKGSFEFRAAKLGGETLLARIIEMVQQAQGSKAPVQRLVDRVAGIFVPVVISIAVLTFAIWMIWGGDNAFTHALLTSVTVLVIACPCALGLATPTAIMVGVGKGAEQHILIRDAESLELGYRVNAVVLDKTGTITEGKPGVEQIRWEQGTESRELKGILFALESRSEHPLAEAIAGAMKDEGMTQAQVDRFRSHTGDGVTGMTPDGTEYIVGTSRLLSKHGIKLSEELQQLSGQWREEAKTVVYFAGRGKVLAVIRISDRLKDTSVDAVRRLQRLGIEVHILSGDNIETVGAVAHELRVHSFQGEMLPAEKAGFIESLQADGKIVAMIGDGINDSHALAQADVSIAMGSGSDIAMDVAKITLMTSDLEAVPKALMLSRKTVRGIRQNLFWAFVYNVIGIPLAAGVLYPLNGFLLNPMIAGAAMAFSSVSVVLNSLRLKNTRI